MSIDSRISAPAALPAVLPSPSPERTAALQEEVRTLARERQAVILAHNYQRAEVQDVADFIGDSLALARSAVTVNAPLIVLCGVHFMAETASVLCPDRVVLLPDLRAGCSLAQSISAEQLRAWKEEHPGAIVVMYVNTSAEVKAESDYCCTSSNAVEVVQHILHERGQHTEILFGPDRWLGLFVQRRVGKELLLWQGECHVHAGITQAHLDSARRQHPDADLMIHPECGCMSSVLDLFDAGVLQHDRCEVLSTGGMLEHARRSDAQELLVATEIGMLHPLRKQSPGKQFVAVSDGAVCEYMKTITLERLRDSLLHREHEVSVPLELASRARVPIERMIAIG